MKELTMSEREAKRTVVLNAVLEKRLTKAQAATALGVSERQVWRLLATYRKDGAAGLVHGNRGRASARATPNAVREQLVQLAAGPCDGANYAHIADLVRQRDGLRLSRWTVRRILKAAGFRSPHRRRRSKHRSRRERYPQEGMLLQVDGSRHQWLGPDGPWLTLIGGIEDATGTVPYGIFREQEDTQGYMLLLQGVALGKGLPLAIYSDRHSVFVSSQPQESLEEQLLGRRRPTQMGRALEEMGIQWIAANSPQAKGRVERLWKTLQERLLLALRLAGASTINDANRVLLEFLPSFNAQFGVSAQQPGTAYQAAPADAALAGILCMKHRRNEAGDNTVAFQGKAIQIKATSQRAGYSRAWVEVQERLDGTIVVCYQGQVLATRPAPEGPVKLRLDDRRKPRDLSHPQSSLGEQPKPEAQESPTGIQPKPRARGLSPYPAKSTAHKPAADHPWRRTVLTKSLHPKH